MQECLKGVKAVAVSVIDIFASSTGNFNITHEDDGERCVRLKHNTLSVETEHEILGLMTLFSVGGSFCPRVLWGGTRRGIGHKHLVGIVIRVW